MSSNKPSSYICVTLSKYINIIEAVEKLIRVIRNFNYKTIINSFPFILKQLTKH